MGSETSTELNSIDSLGKCDSKMLIPMGYTLTLLIYTKYANLNISYPNSCIVGYFFFFL